MQGFRLADIKKNVSSIRLKVNVEEKKDDTFNVFPHLLLNEFYEIVKHNFLF